VTAGRRPPRTLAPDTGGSAARQPTALRGRVDQAQADKPSCCRARSRGLPVERLGMADIVAFTLATNQASRRVMGKVGCTAEREIVHAGLPHVLYYIKRDEWCIRGSYPRI
jgi:hypothetical protein